MNGSKYVRGQFVRRSPGRTKPEPVRQFCKLFEIDGEQVVALLKDVDGRPAVLWIFRVPGRCGMCEYSWQYDDSRLGEVDRDAEWAAITEVTAREVRSSVVATVAAVPKNVHGFS